VSTLSHSHGAIAQKQLDAYNAQDLDAMMAFYAPDVVVSGLNGAPTETSRADPCPSRRESRLHRDAADNPNARPPKSSRRSKSIRHQPTYIPARARQQ